MEKHQNLNYSALDDKTIRRDSFSKEQLSVAGINDNLTWMIFLIPLVIIFVFAAGAFRGVSLLIYGGVALSFFGLVLFFAIRGNRRKFRLLKFTLDNDAAYSAARTKPPSEPIMFNIGHSRYQTETIVFPGGATLAKYQYTVGSGKNSHTYQLNFMQIKLPRAVPHLFLNSKKNAVNPDTFSYEVQKLRLEGDFAKHFDVLAPPNYHIDALQILTPDVMSAIMDYGIDFDFELIGDNLYIYQGLSFAGTPFDSAKNMKKFLMAVEQIVSQFGKQAKTYSDTRAGNVASGLVAKEGARFMKHSAGWPVIIVVILFIIFLVLQFNLL